MHKKCIEIKDHLQRVYVINMLENERRVEKELFDTVREFLTITIHHHYTGETKIQIFKYSFKVQAKFVSVYRKKIQKTYEITLRST